ncbi:MAG: BON domain-containing protein [Methylibium sp.]|uniref:BON domain-containing protein n=1 Tax=Methylibium sp. TaxID=2067992 RepID=UPI0017E4702C|nr:BON domain-containing protein [Methylibium sp.]MBA3596075.1 BON domain-containing protein [Methylibium sp.]
MDRKRLLTPLLVTTFAALALTGCDNRNDTTVGEQVDSAIAKADRSTENARDQMAETARDARAATADVVRDAGNAVSDAAITASVNAELAKDPALSSLRIDVDTASGRVALKGSAPDQGARDRATQLTQSVDGVTAVDNQLTVSKS